MARASVPTLAKINCEALHIEPNDARQRSLVGRLSPWGDTCFWVFIALWHVPIYFINSFIAPERLVQSGPGRFQSTQFNDQNIAKSIASFSVPCAMCHWHIARVLTLLLLVLERLNGLGPDRLCSSWNDDSNIMRSIAICFVPIGRCLWHMARDLPNLVITAEWLIRFGPDRRRSTQASDGSVLLLISGCSRNGTWHGPLARAIQIDKIASRTQTGRPIETGETAFNSSLREEYDKIGCDSLCMK